MTYAPNLYSSLGAGGVLLLREHVPLVQMNYGEFKGHWVLPGGALEPGEHPAQAMVREFHEETGLHVRAAGQLSVRHRSRHDRSADVYWVFRAELASAIAPDGDFPPLRWPPEELLQARFWPVSEALLSPIVRPMTRLFIRMAQLAPEHAHVEWPLPEDHPTDDAVFGPRFTL